MKCPRCLVAYRHVSCEWECFPMVLQWAVLPSSHHLGPRPRRPNAIRSRYPVSPGRQITQSERKEEARFHACRARSVLSLQRLEKPSYFLLEVFLSSYRDPRQRSYECRWRARSWEAFDFDALDLVADLVLLWTYRHASCECDYWCLASVPRPSPRARMECKFFICSPSLPFSQPVDLIEEALSRSLHYSF